MFEPRITVTQRARSHIQSHNATTNRRSVSPPSLPDRPSSFATVDEASERYHHPAPFPGHPSRDPRLEPCYDTSAPHPRAPTPPSLHEYSPPGNADGVHHDDSAR